MRPETETSSYLRACAQIQAHPEQTFLREREDLIFAVFKERLKGMNSRASSGASYEVFLSFQGSDTRHGFTDHLYHGMVEAGILVFRDNESLQIGERIGDELLQAIEKSKLYIPIFSTNYASSHWCLQELAYMIECTSKSNGNKEILPIFLDVEPADVKLKTNLYRKVLSKRQKTFCTEVESWEKALTEVGKIKGWNWKKDAGQGDLIRSIIQTVLVKLKVAYENVSEHLVGVDDHVEAIIKKLDVGSDSVQFLGIYGMGGVGKTTLAKVIFNKLYSSFDRCCFLADVGESSRRHGLVLLQKQLLSTLVGSHSIDQIYDVNGGINMINRVLRNKKVLIVLDDVDEKEQLQYLAGKGNWFGSGSRIIITTRNQSVLAVEEEVTSEGLVKKSANLSTHEVCEMEFDHALMLFSRHAFRRDSPPHHYVSLSEEVVSTLGKLPLALEITGSFLSSKSEQLWVDTLKKLKVAPPMQVQKKLMITYERLDQAQKQVFLDIACFFVNEDKTYPFYMWDDCGYCPHDATEVLLLMSLIKIKDDNTFWMHDQVRDLGREIVRHENFLDPCERSRVWNPTEALSILKQKEGNRKIEALSVGPRGSFWQSRQEIEAPSTSLKHDEFACLRNLRFFHGQGMSLVGDYNELLSNLRWLSWQYCPSELMATNLSLTNLVVLDLSRSSISEEWIGWNQIKEARKLKVLDLSNCEHLMRTPDLSTLESLERLIFEGCRSLIEIDPSIGKLKLLTTLNLNGCWSLRELPEEIGYLQSLTEIVIPRTLREFRLPETFGSLKSLLTFDISHRRISKLPYSIGGLVKLRRLNLSECTYIKELPDSIGKLQSLVELDLSCTSIGLVPDSIGNLKQLTVLRMRQLRGLRKLPKAIWSVEKLEELDIGGCWNLTGEIPEEIGRLSSLRILDLSNTSISQLPTMMSHLSNLQTLNLDPCHELKQLPELPPSLTILRWGPDTITEPDEDPTSIGSLSQLPSSLSELQLRNLATTRSPDFSILKNLSTLRFYSCSMSEFSGIYDAELEDLRMEKCTFGNLDALFQLKMERLRYLEIRQCEFLPEVLDLSHMKNLQQVYLFRCDLLVEICGLEELGSLCSLTVESCSSLERMSDVSKLKKLRELRVRHCPKLRSVETPRIL